MHRTHHTTRTGARPLIALLLGVAMNASAVTPTAVVSADNTALGLKIMADRSLGNCVACHALPGQTGVVSTFGPSLDKVGQRYGEAALRTWVTDARVWNPNTLMPPFGTTEGTRTPNPSQPMLTAAQIESVVAALLSFR